MPGAVGSRLKKPVFVLRLHEDQQLVLLDGTVEDILPASLPGRRNRHTFHGCAPLRAGDDAAPMLTETYQHHVLDPPQLVHELPDVHHADVCHISVARVADVSIVLPDNRLGIRPVVSHQTL